MSRSQKTFRVFVSSTFADLKAERNALQEKVFPELQELCEANGCIFQAIDLRWGVSEETALDQQTMNICLTELKRCQDVSPRPNFIILLGDRYGWIPLPPQIETSEFEEIRSQVADDDRKLLLEWYRLDTNAVPPEYVLRPRREDVFDEADHDSWGKTEERLRAIFLDAINSLGWPMNDERRIKYQCSATHQEIIEGALKLRDEREHVFAFMRNITNIEELPPGNEYIDTGVDKARQLKKTIGRIPGVTSLSYDVTWNGKTIESHIERFTADALTSLKGIIEEELRELKQINGLIQDANQAAEGGDWDGAVEGFRNAFQMIDAGNADLVRKYLAAALANRSILAINHLVKRLSDSGAWKDVTLRSEIVSAIAGLQEAASLDPSSDHIRENLDSASDLLNKLDHISVSSSGFPSMKPSKGGGIFDKLRNKLSRKKKGDGILVDTKAGKIAEKEQSAPSPAPTEDQGSPFMPASTVDGVHFSVTSPQLIIGETNIVSVWTHLIAQREQVVAMAREETGRADIRITSEGPIEVARGTILTVRLSLPNITADPPEKTILWRGEIGKAGFVVTVPTGTKPGMIPGMATILIGGIPITKVAFIVEVAVNASDALPLSTKERRYLTAFASYASEDRDAVLGRIQGILKAVPSLNIFMDVVHLRSGEHWQERLKQEIIPVM